MTRKVVDPNIREEGAAEQLNRLLIVAGDLGLGGAEKQLVELVSALTGVGVVVAVHLFDSGLHYDEAVRAAGATIHSPPKGLLGGGDPFRRGIDVSRLARRFRPDLVIAWRFYLNPYAAIAAQACGVRSLGAVREDLSDAFEGVGRLAPLCLRAPSAIVTNSERSARALNGKGVAVRVLANVIDIAAFDTVGANGCIEPATIPSGRPFVIGVGTLKREKRFDVLLEAFAELIGFDDGAPTPFLGIVGDGPLRAALMLRATQLGLTSDHVAFLGSRNDVPALLHRASLFVLSSEQEGTPNVILEAMAAGRPVVTTDVGDAAVLVQHQQTGLVVPPNAPAALASAMGTVLRDNELAAAFGIAGRQAVSTYGTQGLAQRAQALFSEFTKTATPIEGVRRVRHRWNH